ncbi:hypothetical protein [Scytonema millei]|uniref:Uncharacterized protein n=1 Tax=Scytonema millei VB511283 TaxID=1245923 RepID=A0A9X5E218_9CYAN|nr:hypothetical protein [Scytonema millei]NHC33890.1 hypothetical protein [Scytonema millei VB511283]
MLVIQKIKFGCHAIKTISILCLLLLVSCGDREPDASISSQPPQQESAMSQSSEQKAQTPIFITDYPPSYPLDLLTTGSYFHGNEVQAQSGEQWLGLFSTAQGFELLPTKITVNTVRDYVLDIDETKKTGKEILVDGKNTPIFLVKGSIPLKPGIVKTVFSGNAKFSPNSPPLSVALNLESGNIYQISVKERQNPETIYHALLVYSGKDSIFQEISSCCDDGSTTLLWAGDLDRDGKLDLLIDISNHYHVSLLTLFLSSTNQNKLLEPVGQFKTTGC